MLHKRSLCILEYICSKLNLNCGREQAAFNLCLVNGNTWLLMLRHHWCEQHAWNKTLCLLEAGSNAMLAMRAIVLHIMGWNSYSEASWVFECDVIFWKRLLTNHISLHSLDVFTDYGWSMKLFFNRNPELLGMGRQFGQINFGAFGVFWADLSGPILVLRVPCPWGSLSMFSIK